MAEVTFKEGFEGRRYGTSGFYRSNSCVPGAARKEHKGAGETHRGTARPCAARRLAPWGLPSTGKPETHLKGPGMAPKARTRNPLPVTISAFTPGPDVDPASWTGPHQPSTGPRHARYHFPLCRDACSPVLMATSGISVVVWRLSSQILTLRVDYLSFSGLFHYIS